MEISIARHAIVCNHCSAELGEYSTQQHKNITVNFPTKQTRADGTESFSHETMAFCSKSCLANFLGGDKSSSLASFTAEGKQVTFCDSCKKPIDTKDKDDQQESIAATLKGPDGVNKQYHLHNESCLLDLLKTRSKQKAYKSKASVEEINGILSLDIAADEAYLAKVAKK